METPKDYFEDVLRRFNSERRGLTLFQFCRDERTVQSTLKME